MNHVQQNRVACQMMSRVYFRTLWCPSGDEGKKRLHVNRFQFLFSWLAVFPLTYWLRESDFPGTGSSASSGRSRTHQHKRIKVFEKTLWVQILGFFPLCLLSPLFFLFLSSSFFFSWLIICHVWSSALERGSMAGSQVWPAPRPGRPGLQVAGLWVGVSDWEVGTALCRTPVLCRTCAAACKKWSFCQIIFPTSDLHTPITLPIEQKDNVSVLHWKKTRSLFSRPLKTAATFHAWESVCIQAVFLFGKKKIRLD